MSCRERRFREMLMLGVVVGLARIWPAVSADAGRFRHTLSMMLKRRQTQEQD